MTSAKISKLAAKISKLPEKPPDPNLNNQKQGTSASLLSKEYIYRTKFDLKKNSEEFDNVK